MLICALPRVQEVLFFFPRGPNPYPNHLSHKTKDHHITPSYRVKKKKGRACGVVLSSVQFSAFGTPDETLALIFDVYLNSLEQKRKIAVMILALYFGYHWFLCRKINVDH